MIDKPDPVAVAEQEFQEWCDSSPEAVARAFRKLQSILDHESIRFGNQRLPATIKPYCMSVSHEQERATASELIFAAISALGQLVSRDDAALELIGFDAAARALLQIEPGDNMLPMIARADTLWTKGHGAFVELNTDSPGMAVFSDVLQSAIRDVLHDAELGFVADCQSHQRTDRIIDALIGRYRAGGGDRADPMIAIVDWTGVKTTAEQQRLATALTVRGCRSALFDPSELSYRGGRLYGRDVEIDLVHRRALFPEFLKKPQEVAAMVRAARDGAIVLANPLRSYLAGNKGILALAHDPAFAGRLPKAQQEALSRFIPFTVLVTDETRRMLATADRREWVVKSCFGSGGSEVFLGTVATDDEWLTAIEATHTGLWIAQRAVEIPIFTLPVAHGMDWSSEPHWTNWNPWLIDGAYAGATVRCSMAKVISITGRGALAASFSLPD